MLGGSIVDDSRRDGVSVGVIGVLIEVVLEVLTRRGSVDWPREGARKDVGNLQ